MQIMDEAFDILGCPYQEKMDIYRVSALCMQLGRMEFQGMGEVASPKNLDAAPAINGISYQPINQSINQSGICQYSDNEELIYDCFINPKYKVILLLLLFSMPITYLMLVLFFF